VTATRKWVCGTCSTLDRSKPSPGNLFAVLKFVPLTALDVCLVRGGFRLSATSRIHGGGTDPVLKHFASRPFGHWANFADRMLVIDAREQEPLVFERLTSVRGTLGTGDYSVAGLEDVLNVGRERWMAPERLRGTADAASVLRECEFIVFGENNAFAELNAIGKLGLLMVAKFKAAFDLQFIRRYPISQGERFGNQSASCVPLGLIGYPGQVGIRFKSFSPGHAIVISPRRDDLRTQSTVCHYDYMF
jgi:hypothetical protein